MAASCLTTCYRMENIGKLGFRLGWVRVQIGLGLGSDWVGYWFRLGWVWLLIGLGFDLDWVGFGFRWGSV